MMKLTKNAYIGAGAVFLLSLLMAYSLPMAEIFKGIAAMPAVGVLFSALYQIIRDQAAHERRLELQRKKEFFDLAVTSHMANTTFDKHVEFCEEYLREVHETLSTLLREGPTKEALENSRKLFQLRQKHSAWVTADMAAQLEKFEIAVRTLAAKSGYAEATRTSPRDAEQRSQALDEADGLFQKILGELFDKNAEIDDDIAIERVKSKVRDVLGIEELTKIRQWVVEQAVGAIERRG